MRSPKNLKILYFKSTSLVIENLAAGNSLIINVLLPGAMQLLANEKYLLTQSLGQGPTKFSFWFEGMLTVERRARVRPSLKHQPDQDSSFSVPRSVCERHGRHPKHGNVVPHLHSAQALCIGESREPTAARAGGLISSTCTEARLASCY